MADTDDGGSETGSWRGVSAEPAHGAKTETAVDEGAVVGTNEVAPGVKQPRDATEVLEAVSSTWLWSDEAFCHAGYLRVSDE